MRHFRLIASLVILLPAACAATAKAQSPAAAARQLARQILAFTGRRPSLHLSFTNDSSAGVAQAAELRRDVERRLRAAGASLARTSGKQTTVNVDITLSETWRNLLLVAEMQRGKTKRVAIVPLPRSIVESGAHEAAVVSLSRQIVWRQPAPLVSFLPWHSTRDRSSYLWILDADRLVLYRMVQGHWRRQAGAKIGHANPMPRDVRGRLWIESPGSATATSGVSPIGRLYAALPGVNCSLPLAPARGKLPLSCSAAAAGSLRFPIFEAGAPAARAALVAGRNYFAAAIESGGRRLQLQPFYSATMIGDDHAAPVLVAAATDGKTYLYDDSGKSEGTIDGWGSDIAGIKTSCGSGWQLLATRPGDWTAVDSLAAYEVVDGKAVATGEPIDFPGPVIGLSPAPDGRTADAVVLDRDAGLYEAYTISLSCGR
jgi:hypothetical protein